MLADNNVEEAEIKKKATIYTVLQSCKVLSSAPKSPSDDCLRNKYSKPVPKRKTAVQSQEDTSSKKKKRAKKKIIQQTRRNKGNHLATNMIIRGPSGNF